IYSIYLMESIANVGVSGGLRINSGGLTAWREYLCVNKTEFRNINGVKNYASKINPLTIYFQCRYICI
ncbi:MAG: hypothetical protein L0K69_07880, partial [Enterobacterales bacterium]|nr:hypothetical protein [Enterobacterales bacterium]